MKRWTRNVLTRIVQNVWDWITAQPVHSGTVPRTQWKTVWCFTLLQIHFLNFITVIYVWGAHLSVCVEVRGWMLGVSSLLPPCGSQGSKSGLSPRLVTGAFTLWATGNEDSFMDFKAVLSMRTNKEETTHEWKHVFIWRPYDRELLDCKRNPTSDADRHSSNTPCCVKDDTSTRAWLFLCHYLFWRQAALKFSGFLSLCPWRLWSEARPPHLPPRDKSFMIPPRLNFRTTKGIVIESAQQLLGIVGNRRLTWKTHGKTWWGRLIDWWENDEVTQEYGGLLVSCGHHILTCQQTSFSQAIPTSPYTYSAAGQQSLEHRFLPAAPAG